MGRCPLYHGEGGHECGGLGAPHTYEDESNRWWTSLAMHRTGFRPGGEMSMRLTADGDDWLDAYRQKLRGQYRGIVERMIIYGSKAGEDDHPDSDLDMLLIV